MWEFELSSKMATNKFLPLLFIGFLLSIVESELVLPLFLTRKIQVPTLVFLLLLLLILLGSTFLGCFQVLAVANTAAMNMVEHRMLNHTHSSHKRQDESGQVSVFSYCVHCFLATVHEGICKLFQLSLEYLKLLSGIYIIRDNQMIPF